MAPRRATRPGAPSADGIGAGLMAIHLANAPARPRFDFGPLHRAMEQLVAARMVPGVSTAVISRGEVVDSFCTGWADVEAKVPLRMDHLFRVFSNTKLVT